MSARYVIRDIRDIVAIPKEKRAGFLKDLAAWLEYTDLDPPSGFAVAKDSFIWVDDDDNGKLNSINITMRDFKWMR